MRIHGYQWNFMIAHGFVAIHVHRYQWNFMIAHRLCGHSWLFMDIRECPRMFVDTQGTIDVHSTVNRIRRIPEAGVAGETVSQNPPEEQIVGYIPGSALEAAQRRLAARLVAPQLFHGGARGG